MSNVKGWGFINENLEILCVRVGKDNEKYLELIPWRQANPSEVIIMWSPEVSNLKSVLSSVPFIEILGNEIDMDKLEAIHVEKDDKTIWIG